MYLGVLQKQESELKRNRKTTGNSATKDTQSIPVLDRETLVRFQAQVGNQPDSIQYGPFSDSIEELSGYQAKSFQDGTLDWKDLIHPEDLSGAKNTLLYLLKESHSVTLNYRIKRKNGEYLAVEMAIWKEDGNEGDRVTFKGEISEKNLTLQKENGDTKLPKSNVSNGNGNGNAESSNDKSISEKRYREMESQFLATLNAMQEGYLQTDLDGLIQFSNSRFSELTGFSADELSGINVSTLFIDTFKTKSLNPLQQKKSKIYHECKLQTKSGEELWLLVGDSPMLDADKTAIGYIKLCTDITERKRTQEKLAQSEKEITLISENINPVIYSLSFLGNTRHTNYISPRVEVVLGYTPEEYRSFSEEMQNAFHPDDIGRLTGIMQGVRDTKTPATFTYRFFHKIQREYVWIEESVVPQIDDFGHITGIFGTARDVTQRVLMEEQKNKLAAIVEFSDDAIYSVSPDFKITSWNIGAVKVFGYLPEDIIDLEVSKLHTEEVFAEISPIFDTVMRGSAIKNHETICLDYQGKTIPVNLTFSPLKDANGSVTGLSVVARDITEQKNLMDQLSNSVKEKEVLLQEVHHRVKNNLQIISSLFLLQMTEIDDEKVQKLLQNNIERIKALAMVHEKLYRSWDISNINFKEYLEELVMNLVSSFTSSSLHIDLEMDSEDISLDINKSIPCGMIVNELVSNAFKHAFTDRTEGAIKVTFIHSKEDSEILELSVSDDGKGMDEDQPEEGSGGLGNVLVKSLTTQLQGKMDVISDNGTTIKITFPA